MPLNEKDLRDAVINTLKWDSRIDASGIIVEVKDSVIILSGTVPYLTSRNVAENDAYNVPGVHSVTNRLTVRSPVSAPPDREIQSNIKNVLFWDSSIDSARIGISVIDGSVMLKGTISSYWSKKKAEDLASRITGVVKVINELAVVPTQWFPDEDIAKRIVEAFEQDIYIIADSVTVHVNEGKVTLSGTTPSWIAKLRAGKIAGTIEGVTAVVNGIAVGLSKNTD